MATTEQLETLCDILDMDSDGITPDTALSSLEGWDSMAIVMITGLMVATIVTLLFTPVYYSLLDSLDHRIRGRLRRREEELPCQE